MTDAELLKKTGRDKDPFRDVGTLNAQEREESEDLALSIERFNRNPAQVEKVETI